MDIKIKRIYEEPQDTDGLRILVDRLWPRGLSKEQAQVDIWLKEIAPSSALRQWYAHDTNKWQEFRVKYIEELSQNSTVVKELLSKIKTNSVTLLYSAKEQKYNNARVLKEYLESMLDK